jgi:hypothetical protein
VPNRLPAHTSLETLRSTANRSDATRYLCAAAQLESGFTERVIEELVAEELRAVPTSPGVDLTPVVKHALAARTRQRVRDILLLLTLLALVVAFFSFNVLLFVLLLVIGWGVVLGEQLIAVYGVVAGDLTASNFNADAAPMPRQAHVRRRVESIASQTRGNVTVYSGYNAFSSYGVRIGAWSFLLDVRKARTGSVVTPLDADELHSEVWSRVHSLDVGSVTTEDRLFVDGRDLRGDRRFLPGGDVGIPAPAVDAVVVRALRLNPEDRVRPYACFHIVGWRGQLVLSTFFRSVVTDQHLFVEVTHTVMPPVREEFQEVDHLLSRPTMSQLGTLAARSLRRTPLRLISSVRALRPSPTSQWQLSKRRREQRRQIDAALRFDYGAHCVPRQIASDSRYQRYFQELDGDHYAKAVERAVLEAVLEALNEHGIDTSEFEQRQTTILNNGVYVTGGASVHAGSVAAGAGAQARTGFTQAVNDAASRVASRPSKGS